MAVQAVSEIMPDRLSYYDYDFGPFQATKIESTFVYDDANRAIIGTQYSLTVSWLVAETSSSGADTEIELLCKRLSKPMQALRIHGLGFGERGIFVTGADAAGLTIQKDLRYGPKPKVLSCVPIGAGLGWELTWQVEFFVNENASIGGQLGWVAINYGVDYTIGDDLRTTRTIKGYVQIAANVVAAGQQRIEDTADAVRDRLQFVCPVGFRPIPGTYSVSPDKARLDFSVVHEQFPGSPPPPWIVKADGAYRIASTAIGFQKWKASLSLNLQAAPGHPKAVLGNTFMAIARKKVLDLRAKMGSDGIVFPEHIDVSNQLFGQGATFNISFMVCGCLTRALRTTGLWDPVYPLAEWAMWYKSLEPLFRSRGQAGLYVNKLDDAVIDVGDGVTEAQLGNDGARPVVMPYTTAFTSIFGGNDITKENSFVHFEAHLHWAQESALAARAVSAVGNTGIDLVGLAAAGLPGFISSKLGQAMGQAAANEALEATHAPSSMVIFQGKMLRLKYRASRIPELLSVGPCKVQTTGKGNIDQRVVGCFFDVPMYLTRWAKLYHVIGGTEHSLEYLAGRYKKDAEGMSPETDLCCDASPKKSDLKDS